MTNEHFQNSGIKLRAVGNGRSAGYDLENFGLGFGEFLNDETNVAIEFCDCMRVLVGNGKEKAL
ncbi:MAG: hypothetical protein V4520_18080 [Bacteroidota bacterium]